MSLQPLKNKLLERNLFYQDDNNIYHVACKKILQAYLQESENIISCDDEYDYEFFFRSSHDFTEIFHVTCKLLSCSSIVSLLNKEIYGMDFDVKDLKRRYTLTLHQKLILEENLKQILPLYFSQPHIPDNEVILDSNEALMSSFHEVGNQDGFESGWSRDGCVSQQDENYYVNHQ
ncbi:hypothetical protein RclHR1_02200006 [Rhizophagus clarus]|uniref:Uncharacterized protein n=1 Tax=Rhizophagus clarus TaxID=94130 RepID=A0A2Z6QVI1_9GLOM|nr:hypothetical protein RclHR1_02200006 [Rhizophagus clarus]GES79591.1 hypothetical protein GLOIN_2v1775730 [Rhizophagus clarus]